MSLPVEVIRSKNRRKTVHAELVDGVVRVLMPEWVSKADEAEYVTQLVTRLEQRHLSHHVDLATRCTELAAEYSLPLPTSIRWVDNMQKRWGSCTIGTGDIRISRRLAPFPPWVLDYVVLHELAHLVEPDHSPAFYQLLAHYPMAERAEGFLLGVECRTGEAMDDLGVDDEASEEVGARGSGDAQHPAGAAGDDGQDDGPDATVTDIRDVTWAGPAPTRRRGRRQRPDDPNALTLF